MVQAYRQTYNIPNWGKIYLHLIVGNSGSDSVTVNILENKKELETIYETNKCTEAEVYVEGFLENLVRNNKNIPCPDSNHRKKNWTEIYKESYLKSP